MRRSLLPIVLFAATVASAQPARPPAPSRPIQVTPESLTWIAVRPPLPEGVELAVLEGDPQKDGLYTIRLRVPAGTRLPTHWHLQHERVTVLSGMVELAFADNPETKRLGAGSYYVNPPMNLHAMFFPEPTLLQVTGLGPWRSETGEKKASSATISIVSVRPSAGTVVASADEIVVEVEYAIEGFRPDMYDLSMQFDTVNSKMSVGCGRLIVTGAGEFPPRPPKLKNASGREILRCRPDTFQNDVARPLRFRVFLIESTGPTGGSPIAKTPYVDFK
ncbi:MAG: cupin domain-containing protein [Thermoanaerobaculia bacterium]